MATMPIHESAISQKNRSAHEQCERKDRGKLHTLTNSIKEHALLLCIHGRDPSSNTK